MKTNKGFRHTSENADELHKAKRLEPIHKSGKERHVIYNEMDDDEPITPYTKKESVFDYIDDEK